MAASVSTRLWRPYLPEVGGQTFAEVEVEPGDQTQPANRHVALVVDTSGSMSAGGKIYQARDGANWVFGMLDPDDYVSIVSFDSNAEVVLEATRWGDLEDDAARDHVGRLTASGGTDIYAGLEAAADELKDLPYDETTARHVLLLSDGKDNKLDPEDFEQQALDIDEMGIRIQAAGIGDDYDEETIRRLGETARGEWVHLDDPNDIKDFFSDKLAEISTLVARDAHLRIDVEPGVEVSEVYRSLPQVQQVDVDWSGNTAIVKLPDLLERQRQKVVLRFHAPGHDVGQDVTLADVTLNAAGEYAEDSVGVTYTDDESKLGIRNEDVAIAHYETVARKHAGEGNIDEAATVLDEARTVATEETTVEIDHIEEEVTTVESRLDQYETTIIETDERQVN